MFFGLVGGRRHSETIWTRERSNTWGENFISLQDTWVDTSSWLITVLSTRVLRMCSLFSWFLLTLSASQALFPARSFTGSWSLEMEYQHRVMIDICTWITNSVFLHHTWTSSSHWMVLSVLEICRQGAYYVGGKVWRGFECFSKLMRCSLYIIFKSNH